MKPRRVDIVIARHDGYTLRRSQSLQPGEGHLVFARQSEIGDIPCNRDVVRVLGQRISGNQIRNSAIVNEPASAMPIQKSECTFGVPIARMEALDGGKVNVRNVRYRESFGHLRLWPETFYDSIMKVREHLANRTKQREMTIRNPVGGAAI